MEHQLVAAEKEELVKVVQIRDLQGKNGGWKKFLDVSDKKFGSSMSDPSRHSHEELVAFLASFKKKEDLQALHCHANHLMIEKLKQKYPDKDTPEQDCFVSDVGMKMSNVMISIHMVAVACEMVLCEDGTEGLVRVGAVDRNLKVILDEFVKPHKPVVDYRTTITGVTAEDIRKATLSVVDM